VNEKHEMMRYNEQQNTQYFHWNLLQQPTNKLQQQQKQLSTVPPDKMGDVRSLAKIKQEQADLQVPANSTVVKFKSTYTCKTFFQTTK